MRSMAEAKIKHRVFEFIILITVKLIVSVAASVSGNIHANIGNEVEIYFRPKI